MNKWIQFSAEVAEAAAQQRPIVALESTIISHGMPYPVNVETALEVEQIIRDEGAVPATIAILDGKIHVGLAEEELQLLARTDDVLKVSRRDLPYALATGKPGATTVAATMICANLAGISVFVTGGIGGVHRGAEHTMDISADLLELSKTDVAVVCAGAKSILDIGFTLEYLETHGVPVIGYQTNEFPAFYSRHSGFEANYKLDTPEQVAVFLQTKWNLGLKGGAVIGNPVPEKDELPRQQIDTVINQALEAAEKQGVHGKAVTPFLLDRVKELTLGESLTTNIALVRSNAHVGAQIAMALNSGTV
ncbi:pseudouridine-5'-phosphate glycosidase [Alicyclobacillus sp. SO9]|uniref:pseudouridine-5'-phosphate glycosidase n=1 Tax=Alicyclobacillus sp. SO9 TaxID=2665646 RepID=UPI0018E8008B|nr:pseudouridine-5'-phosphate glycosidase [Alicyclobacillus sp. SO9]QQE77812.1 pseudouridine-5'-phosphate glycosidase [Alicyclobacillus sp. SO9]